MDSSKECISQDFMNEFVNNLSCDSSRASSDSSHVSSDTFNGFGEVASHVAKQTDIKRYSNNTLFQFQYLHFKGSGVCKSTVRCITFHYLTPRPRGGRAGSRSGRRDAYVNGIKRLNFFHK